MNEHIVKIASKLSGGVVVAYYPDTNDFLDILSSASNEVDYLVSGRDLCHGPGSLARPGSGYLIRHHLSPNLNVLSNSPILRY